MLRVSPEGVFLFFAVFGGVVLVVRFIFYFIGSGSIEDFPVDVGDSLGVNISDSSLQDFAALNLHTVSAFSLLAGIAGYGMLKLEFSLWIVSCVAVISGCLGIFAVSRTLFLAKNLQSDGTVKIQSAVGKSATVYLSIKPKLGGKIQVYLQQRLLTYDAYTTGDSIIPTGVLVKIVKIVDGKLIVEPWRDNIENVLGTENES